MKKYYLDSQKIGITRGIDSLGRIVIPKDKRISLRQNLPKFSTCHSQISITDYLSEKPFK